MAQRRVCATPSAHVLVLPIARTHFCARGRAPSWLAGTPSLCPAAPQKLSEELEEWEQTEDQDSLKAVAAVLGSAKLLRHRDGDVK